MHLSPSIGVWVAVFLTLCVLSFLYKDNPFYKFAEHLVVGVSVGYGMVLWYTQGILPKFITPFFKEGKYIYIVPAILGIMITMQLVRKYAWLARFPMAFLLGASSGIGLPRTMQAGVIKQLEATMVPMGFSRLQYIWNIVIFVGVLSVLIYFFFSKEHKGVFGGIANIGIWYLMIGFGATFGYTVMARLSLFIGRMLFIIQTALGVQVAG